MSSRISMSEFLPQIDNSLILWKALPQQVQAKFEYTKQRVRDAFANISLRRFDQHPEFADIGEVVFILKKAYCQTLIHYADACTGDIRLLQDSTDAKQALDQQLSLYNLQQEHKHYQYRLKLAFEMVVFISTDFNQCARLAIVQGAYKKALLQWDEEMREVCRALGCVQNDASNAVNQALMELGWEEDSDGESCFGVGSESEDEFDEHIGKAGSLQILIHNAAQAANNFV